MNFSGQLSVDFYFGIGHGTAKSDYDILAFVIGRNFEFIFVKTFFLAGFFLVQFLVPAAIGVFAKTFQFPLRGNIDFGPSLAVVAFGAIKIPLHGMFKVFSGKIYFIGLLGKNV